MDTGTGARPVRTRAELAAAYGVGRSTLEKWYRERSATGHPEAAGTVGRELVWDAAEWDAWYTGRSAHEAAPPGLVTRDQLAAAHGLSRHALKKLWSERETNGHPPPAHRHGKALYWDAERWAGWYERYLAGEAVRRRGSAHPAQSDGGRGRNGENNENGENGGSAEDNGDAGNGGDDRADLVTLAEAGRMLGLAPSSVTVYAGRPPAGWPEPVQVVTLGGGRARRLYRRSDITAYAAARRSPGSGRA